MKKLMMVVVANALCVFPLFAQWGTTTYYNGNGSYGGSARTTQLGNSTQTTFGNQSTTYHYGADGLSTGRSQTTTFGNQTTTTHYNQYGQPIGTSMQYR